MATSAPTLGRQLICGSNELRRKNAGVSGLARYADRPLIYKIDAMELVTGPPSHWALTLLDGSVVDIWADTVSGICEKTADDSHIVFHVSMDIDPDDQDHFEVTARVPADRRRVEVAVARFPRNCVQEVLTA